MGTSQPKKNPMFKKLTFALALAAQFAVVGEVVALETRGCKAIWVVRYGVQERTFGLLDPAAPAKAGSMRTIVAGPPASMQRIAFGITGRAAGAAPFSRLSALAARVVVPGSRGTRP